MLFLIKCIKFTFIVSITNNKQSSMKTFTAIVQELPWNTPEKLHDKRARFNAKLPKDMKLVRQKSKVRVKLDQVVIVVLLLMILAFLLGIIYRTSGGRWCLTGVPYIDWLERGGTPMLNGRPPDVR
jgi:hypothetical protein